MGIGGHILGEKKLRQLRQRTGLDLDRAFRRSSQCEGRVIEDGECIHYDIDWETGVHAPIGPPLTHWTSCPKRTPHKENQ